MSVILQEHFLQERWQERCTLQLVKCVSFCNQPKEKFGYLTRVRESRRYVVAFTSLRVEAFGYVKRSSLRHILASLGTPLGQWRKMLHGSKENSMLVKRLAYPSIFNHFWNIAIYRWRVIDFQQSREVNERFFYHILLSMGTPLLQSR